MKPPGIPLASHEVRWFFEGKSTDHQAMRDAFEQSNPFPRDAGIGPPAWKGRADGEPDVYLLVPGADDLGIKWREGELQVKGRVAELGTQVFGGRHQGRVERWVKWSYSDLPDSYKRIVTSGDAGGDAASMAVFKNRALRKMSLDTATGAAKEIDTKRFVDRGVYAELTDLTVADKVYCSLGFEAFPDDAAMHAAFSRAVAAFLAGLPADLSAAHSMSYPEWLRRGIR